MTRACLMLGDGDGFEGECHGTFFGCCISLHVQHVYPKVQKVQPLQTLPTNWLQDPVPVRLSGRRHVAAPDEKAVVSLIWLLAGSAFPKRMWVWVKNDHQGQQILVHVSLPG